MSKIVEQKMYVCSDALNNNNKFWEYILYDDDTVAVKYGRVGKTSAVDGPKAMTRTALNAKIREKLKGSGKEGTSTYKPPYREISVVPDTLPTGPSGPTLAKVAIHEAAKTQLAKSNPLLTGLVTRLVEANKHELFKASGGKMDIDLTTGIISTPIGVVTKSNILSARTILNDLSTFVTKKDFDSKDFVSNLNDYLMLIPQTVGHSRGWHRTFMTENSDLQRQNTLLDQLDASADIASARILAAVQSGVASPVASTPSLFDAELDLLTDKAEIARITDYFMKTINNRHESKNLRPIQFYKVSLPKAEKDFSEDGAKLKDIRQLWHGTRIFNVLSILKNGLMMPNTLSTMQVTGAMFGNGIYFSDQSTKSLNYAYGYWGGGQRENNCFMFLFDVAMGNYHIPKSSYESLPKKDFDSTWARPGMSGILNDEMIVYRRSQQVPRYLIEFDQK